VGFQGRDHSERQIGIDVPNDIACDDSFGSGEAETNRQSWVPTRANLEKRRAKYTKFAIPKIAK